MESVQDRLEVESRKRWLWWLERKSRILVTGRCAACYGDARKDCEHVFKWSVMSDIKMTSRMCQIDQDEQYRLDDVLKKQMTSTLFTRDTVRSRDARYGAEQSRDSSVLWLTGGQSFRVCYEDVTHVPAAHVFFFKEGATIALTLVTDILCHDFVYVWKHHFAF